MSNDQGERVSRELVAWWLFTGSALFFLIVALRDGDVLSIAAAALFLAGCLVFLAGERR